MQGLVGDAVLDVGPPRRRSILAVLLAHAGEPVSTESLVAAVWGPGPPERAINVVHKHIGALRRLVEPDLRRRAQGSWLTSQAGTYRVAVDEETLDLLRFRSLVREAGEATDDQRSLDRSCEALELWSGRAAEDVRSTVAEETAFRVLDREFAEAVAATAERGRDSGRPERPLMALELATRLEPTDERLHEQYVLCLAAAGRRGEALAVFRDVRHRLIEELGIEPGPALHAANQAVLEDRVGSPRTLPTPAQIPADLRMFVGRGRELRALAQLVPKASQPSALAVITGTPGVGKTSLAVHFANRAARAFPGGQLHVDLRGFDPAGRPRSPEQVLGRFLQALDIPAEKIPADLDGRSALWRSATASRPMLIVLDNARDTAQVKPLLVSGSGSLTLVTSRVQLRALSGIADEVLSLGLFSATESSNFLTRRLGSRRSSDAVAALAMHRASGGLPLSLALLAARALHAPDIGLADLAETVGEQRASLAPFVDRADERTDARAVLSWSYDALSPSAARVLRALSLHPGAVEISTVAALGDADAAEAAELLDELVEANLLTELRGRRYIGHDLLRRFAGERLEETREGAAAEARMYAERALRAARAARAVSTIRYEPARTDWLPSAPPPSDDFEDARAALEWFKTESDALVALVLRAHADRELDAAVWKLAWALELYLDRQGQWSDAQAVHRAAIAAAQRSGSPIAEALACRALARVRAHLGDLAGAAELVDRVLELVAPDGDEHPVLVAEAHRYLSWILEQQDEFEPSLAHARAALSSLGPEGWPAFRSAALNQLGRLELLLGDYPSAFAHCSAAVELLGATPHPFQLANAYSNLGSIHGRQGRFEEAVRSHERAIGLFRSLGSLLGEGRALHRLGETLQAGDQVGEARSALTASHELLADLQHAQAALVRTRLDELPSI